MLRLLTALLVASALTPVGTADAQIYVAAGRAKVNGCDTCGLEASCSECAPVWRPYASAEMMWLDRSQGDPQPYIVNQPGAVPVTDVADLSYSVRAGFRGTLGLEHENGNGAEIRYFVISDQPATFVTGGTSLVSNVFNELSTNVGVTNMTTGLVSNLHSGELNWVSQWGRLRPIFGVRWLRLTEQWDVYETALTTTGTTAQQANSMIGGQLGLGFNLWESESGMRVDGKVLGAVLNNDFELSAHRHDAVNVFNAFNARGNDVAYAAQIDITARWQPNRKFALFAGYTGFWMENVALITDQSDDFTLATGAGTFDLNDVVFQGGHFGMELAW